MRIITGRYFGRIVEAKITFPVYENHYESCSARRKTDQILYLPKLDRANLIMINLIDKERYRSLKQIINI